MIKQRTTKNNNSVSERGLGKNLPEQATCETAKFLIKLFCPYYFNLHNLGIKLIFIVFTHSPPQCFQNVTIVLCVFSEIKISSPSFFFNTMSFLLLYRIFLK